MCNERIFDTNKLEFESYIEESNLDSWFNDRSILGLPLYQPWSFAYKVHRLLVLALDLTYTGED